MTNYKETRPWGTFENLLDTNYCKVKKIVIKPGQAPSYQYHFKRSEVWVVVQGEGELTLNDETEQVTTGRIIYVPVKAKHQIENNLLDKIKHTFYTHDDYPLIRRYYFNSNK